MFMHVDVVAEQREIPKSDPLDDFGTSNAG